MSNILKFTYTKIDGVDTQQGIARYGGKADRYLKSLRRFAASLPSDLLEYDEIVSEDGAVRGTECVHTIKGVAGNLGMTKVYEAAVAFEASMHAKSPDKDLYLHLKEMCVAVSQEILTKTEEFVE